MVKINRGSRNRTITLTEQDRNVLRHRLVQGNSVSPQITNRTIVADCFEVARQLQYGHADLLILDPPYNITKTFGENKYSRTSTERYSEWIGKSLDILLPLVKPTGTVYICGDWYTSISVFSAASPRLKVRNRITWERDKGRGSKTNWKNNSEDIWFCTIGESYTFNVDPVKIRRRVVAPYRTRRGAPKDWRETIYGNFRDTHPSNLWTDITVPFWSMAENTCHPAQKSEKLVAKLVLASTNPGDLVLDPFLGSGTSSVVARKLGRRYLGIEIEEEYALLAEKRLETARRNGRIQGYADNVFWERNTSNVVKAQSGSVQLPD